MDTACPKKKFQIEMDSQTLFTLMVDLHRDGGRQGPGSETETRRALGLNRLTKRPATVVQTARVGFANSLVVLK